MFTAINVRKDKILNSLNVINNPLYPFPSEEEWYADPNEIQNYDKNKIKDVSKIEIVWVKEKICENEYGTKYPVSPHFRIPNKNKLGINTIPESKEHKLVKDWIYNRIMNEDISFVYSTINKPYKYNNSITYKKAGLDNTRFGIPEVAEEKVEKEVGSKDYINIRIADVICPFFSHSDFFGDGIVFEIQLSKQRDKITEKRTNEWINKGYSVVWLFEKDFEMIGKDIIKLKNNDVNIISWVVGLSQLKKKIIKDFKIEVKKDLENIENALDEIDERKQDLIEIKESLDTTAQEKIDYYWEEKLNNLPVNFFEEVSKKIQNDFFKDKREEVINLIREVLPFYLKEIAINEINDKVVDKLEIPQLSYDIKETVRNDLMKLIGPTQIIMNLLQADLPCSKCGTNLRLKESKYGKLGYACPNFNSGCSNWIDIPKSMQDRLKPIFEKII